MDDHQSNSYQTVANGWHFLGIIALLFITKAKREDWKSMERCETRFH
jgi:hypothetical protein